ncbi:MAG: DUF885 domain-containing protein [Phycisphaerae bacterium]|nr:DUF885 domain-containing protein [Phycisphaerae bacterium]
MHHATHRPSRPRARLALALGAWLAASGATRGQPALALEPDMAEDIARMAADVDEYARFFDIRWSEELLDAQHEFLRSRLDALRATDFDRLGQAGRVDYLLMRNNLRSAISANRLSRQHLGEMDPLLPFRGVIVPLERARWRMTPLDPRAAAGELAKIPEAAKAARAWAEARRARPDRPADAPPLLSPVIAQRAARATEQLTRSLERWYEYYDGFEPAFSWWCAKPYEGAKQALGKLSRFLREEIAGVRGKPEDPLIGDPIGREALLEALRDECVGRSPEDLIAIGDAEFAWCEAEMKRAAAEVGLGDDRRAALARVKQDSPGPGEQTAYVTAVAREAVQFLKDRDLVTIPDLCDQTWRIQMISPETQRVLPFAVYYGQAIGVAYPTSAMPHEDKLMSMRGNNRHFTRIVVPHELIPGHHLQRYLSNRERPYRLRFDTPFYVEGWALHWEMRLWDLGWARTPEERIGMLFWRMHRCARITVSLRFHLGEMSPAQMVDFLVDRVGHERFGATSEVRRYIGGDYGPLYQAGYMIGGKQVRALWRETTKAGGGGSMTERAFHDAVLGVGPIPIELVRAQLLGTPLNRDSEAAWAFPTDQP